MRTIIALGIAGVLAGPVAARTIPMTRDTGVPVGLRAPTLTSSAGTT